MKEKTQLAKSENNLMNGDQKRNNFLQKVVID